MADDEQREPLLKKTVKYHENCPGCKVDKHKEKQRGYPLKELILIGLLVLTNALPIASLFSFIYFMVRDFHIAKTADIGYYAGCIGSSLMFGRFLTSALWGVAADKYGRKPVMIIGISSVVVFNTLFGLSINFWMAIATRFLLGSFNGLLGPVKAYASEICRDEHQALALSIVSTAWGIGLIIGPALGGFLAQPADKYPKIFSETSIFGRFPYFLPCLAISMLSLMVLVAAIWLPETLHNHPLEGKEKGNGDQKSILEDNPHKGDDDPESSLEENLVEEENEGIIERQKVNKKSLFRNWPVMASIIVYCVYSLHDIAYLEIFALWAESPRTEKGLGFTTDDVGIVLAITGGGLLLFQLIIFPPLANYAGAILLIRIAAILTILLLTSYPFIAMLSGVLLWVIVTCASVLKNALAATIYTGTFLLLNNSVSQDQRGAANGLAMTGMSLFKTFGPLGGGSVFAWAQTRENASFLPGNEMVFFMLNVILVIVVAMTFEPFLPRSTDRLHQLNGETNSNGDEESPLSPVLSPVLQRI